MSKKQKLELTSIGKENEKEAATFRADLCALNNAQRGSFGEFLFSRVAREKLSTRVEATRRNRADFVVGDLQVDVKTTIRDLARELPPLRPYRGPRFSGISYAVVELFSRGARVSLESESLLTFTPSELVVAWHEWKGNARLRTRSGASTDGIAPLRDRIVARFRDLGFRARVIYRTIQAQFGDESPSNLLPSHVNPKGITVFLDFIDQRLEETNIRRIIAFPDIRASELPVRDRTRLHKQKVDLSRLPSSFLFESLFDLLSHAEMLTRLGTAPEMPKPDCSDFTSNF